MQYQFTIKLRHKVQVSNIPSMLFHNIVVYLTHLYNNPLAVIPVKTGIQKQKNWIPDQVRNDNK